MDVRKVSVGSDYKNAMHYVVGQKVLGDTNEIHLIRKDSSGTIKIYIINKKNEIVLWKEFNNNTPISIEFNIDF